MSYSLIKDLSIIITDKGFVDIVEVHVRYICYSPFKSKLFFERLILSGFHVAIRQLP